MWNNAGGFTGRLFHVEHLQESVGELSQVPSPKLGEKRLPPPSFLAKSPTSVGQKLRMTEKQGFSNKLPEYHRQRGY